MSFPPDVVAAVDSGKILGIRAGRVPHRFIGIWAVVVDGRVFVRSWDRKPGGWYDTLLDEPRGVMQVPDGREVRVRAVQTKSERLKDAVDEAYRAKYRTPASLKYVRGFARPGRRAATIELVPVGRVGGRN